MIVRGLPPLPVALALVAAACTAGPGESPFPGKQMTAGFVPPAECGPPTRVDSMLQCGWRRAPTHTFEASLTDAKMSLHELGFSDADAALVASAEAGGPRVDWLDMTPDVIEAVVMRGASRETNWKIWQQRQPSSRNPPGARECVRYGYTAEDRNVPAAPGAFYVLRGAGLSCSRYLPKTKTMQLATVELSERYSRDVGDEPASDFDELSGALLASLRLY